MKQFLFSLLIFITFLFILIFVLGRNYHFSGTSNYMDAIIDKHDLLEKTHSPRLLLCGGSNLTFGIDSKRIQDSIGLPVINMALHAGLGLDFIINEIKLAAKPSDFVLLSIEYNLKTKGNYRLEKLTAKNFPLANQFFKTNYYTDLIYFFKEDLKTNLVNNLNHLFTPKNKNKLDSTYLYSRSSFNIYGDMVRHLTLPLPQELTDREQFTYKHWDGINILNDFAEYAKSNNIKVYFLYPNYPKTEYTLNKVVISKLAGDLENELKIKILNKPSDFVFDDSLFFDTIYHLNKFGREQRTNLLIRIIKTQIQSDKS